MKVKRFSSLDYGELGKDRGRGENGKVLTKEEVKKDEVLLLPPDNEYMDLVWHCLETMATREFIKDKRTALEFYQVAINSPIARFSNFVVKEFFGTALPGKENMGEFENMAISPEDARRRYLRALFSPELLFSEGL